MREFLTRIKVRYNSLNVIVSVTLTSDLSTLRIFRMTSFGVPTDCYKSVSKVSDRVSMYPLKRRNLVLSIDIMRWPAISLFTRCFPLYIRFPEREDLNFRTPHARSRLFFRRVDASGKFLAATSSHCIHVLWFSYPVILHLNRLLFTRHMMFFIGTLPIFLRPLNVSLICKWSFPSFIMVNIKQRYMMLVEDRK